MGRGKKQTRGTHTSVVIGGIFIQEQLSRNGKMGGRWKTWVKSLYVTSGRKWTQESGQTSLCWMKSLSGDTNNCHQLSSAGKIPWPNLNKNIWIAVAATGRKNQKLALWRLLSQALTYPNVPVEKSHKSADLHLSPVTYLRAEFTEMTTHIRGLKQEELIHFLRNHLIARPCL